MIGHVGARPQLKATSETSLFKLNNYSTANLPRATVTQTWNINEAMSGTRPSESKLGSVERLPKLNTHKSVDVLSIPIPIPAYYKSTSNKVFENKKPGIEIKNRMLPEHLQSKYATPTMMSGRNTLKPKIKDFLT